MDDLHIIIEINTLFKTFEPAKSIHIKSTGENNSIIRLCSVTGEAVEKA